jgi:hypothetical protein
LSRSRRWCSSRSLPEGSAEECRQILLLDVTPDNGESYLDEPEGAEPRTLLHLTYRAR